MGKQKSLWTLPLLRSRIRQDRVTVPEMIIGYFLGPFRVLVMSSVVSTYYLICYRTI